MKKAATSPITSEDELKVWIEKSETMLLIVDIHRGWSGRCETLIPTFEAICIQYDRSEERVAFLSMSVDLQNLTKIFESLVQEVPPDLVLDKKGCAPLYLAIKSHKVVAVVEGADPPRLIKLVKDHIPSISSDDDILDGSQDD